MAVAKDTKFVCTVCKKTSSFRLGKCPSCNSMNSFVAFAAAPSEKKTKHITTRVPTGVPARSQPMLIEEISSNSTDRFTTGVGEFDRVLGGGVVLGSMILIGGQPGSGKSTLLIQTASLMSQTIGRVLYVSGEESEGQIKMRADRLGIGGSDLYLVFETDIDTIINEYVPQYKPKVIIIDSIQTLASSEIAAAAGSPTQVRYCTGQLQHLSKSTGLCTFIVGQVTKEGDISGPNSLSHGVDTVLYLEGDEHNLFRLLRAEKNRFGSVGEIGVFEMTALGMIEVSNPSAAFLAERATNKSGSSVAITMEGTRPIIVETQALCIDSPTMNPTRRSSGVNRDRLFLIAAVLDKYIPVIDLMDTDLFVGVVGGMKITETSADLSLALAIVSSWHNAPTPHDLAAIGEIGLTGELRSVTQVEMRLREAANLGFKRVIVSPLRRNIKVPDGLEIFEAKTVEDAIRYAFGDSIPFDDDLENIKRVAVSKRENKRKKHDERRAEAEENFFDENIEPKEIPDDMPEETYERTFNRFAQGRTATAVPFGHYQGNYEDVDPSLVETE